MRTEQGFTLIELMIVVAIIGILASVAVPTFISMKYRTQRGEVPLTLDGIQKSEMAYRVEFDSYVTCPQEPDPSTMGNLKRAFNPDQPGWRDIAYSPDGEVYGTYMVTANNLEYTIIGETDLDIDSNISTYSASNGTRPHAITPPGFY